MEQTDIAILPAQTRGLGQLGEIVESFWEMFSRTLQFESV